MKHSTYNLTHRIYIERPKKDELDEYGNPVQNPWESISENPIWAAKRGLRGRTFYAAAAVQAEDNILFTVRCNSVTTTVTADMRIVEGTHIYKITAPPTDVGDTHQWIEIHAKEVT